jgi:hypothetical protein
VPAPPRAFDPPPSPAEYVRAIERYVCQKNDGHLIRVVGPAFDIVSGWERDGIPLKVAQQGIDRYFERYYRSRSRKGATRRRPVRVEFCDADVLDVFDDWRRAVGITRRVLDRADEAGAEGGPADADAPPTPPDDSSSRPVGRGLSLSAHLERVLLKLSSARATGRIGPEMDRVIDRVSLELDAARVEARGLRGETRRALIERLATLDRELVDAATTTLANAVREGLEVEADRELAGYRARLAPDAYRRAHQAVVDRLVREHALLPVIAFA